METLNGTKQTLPGYTGTPSPEPWALQGKQLSPRVKSALDNVDLSESMNGDDDTPRVR